jgi:hypothetical protein
MATATQLSQAKMYNTKNAASIEEFGRTTSGMNAADVKAITEAIAENGTAWMGSSASIRSILGDDVSGRLI